MARQKLDRSRISQGSCLILPMDTFYNQNEDEDDSEEEEGFAGRFSKAGYALAVIVKINMSNV